MDALKHMVSATGCAPDGSALASNPMGALADSLLNSGPAGGGASMAMPARPTMAVEMEGGHHPDVFRGGPSPGGPPGGPPLMGRQRSYGDGPDALGGAWAASSGGAGGPGGPPPHAAMMRHASREAEAMGGAWADSRAAAGAGGQMSMGGPRGAPVHAAMSPQMRMMAARGMMGMHMTAMQGMGMMPGPLGFMGAGPMMHARPPPPPPQQQQTAEPRGAEAAEAPAAEAAAEDRADVADDDHRAMVGDHPDDLEHEYERSMAARLDSALPHDAPAGGGEDLAARTRATSRALADSLASNDDPRFARSELVSFLSQVGDGELEIAADDNTVRQGTARSRDGAPRAAEATGKVEEDEGDFDAMWQRALNGEEVDMTALWARALGGGEGEGDGDLERMLSNMRFDDTAEYGGEEAARMAAAWAEAGQGVQAAADTTYALAEDNPYEDEADAFALGQRLFDEGKLNEAALAFESCVKKHEDHSEAWRMLGVCHAENDEDRKAIVCLQKAVEQDPYNLDALLALGVSYVNELDHENALKTLQSWVQHNPKFAGLKFEADHYSDGTLMDEVAQLMIKAQEWDPTDAEVKVVLGVLYNVSRDYDSAIAAFSAALDNKPDDYSLWNKLGATRANSSRSKEALPAYRRALELKPTYARGWLNLGISHANLGDYEAAAKAYLHALRLNPKASHIWSYVRIAFTCLERFDLVELAERADVNAFEDWLAGRRP